MSKPSSARIAKDENRRRLKELMERYGTLLTEKQASMVSAYAVEGMSFSEVARQSKVSRQAVHESVRSAERVLSEYDDKLKHLTPQQQEQFNQQNLNPNADISQVVSKLESLKMRIAKTGIIYSVDWIRREIDTVMTMLEPGSEEDSVDGREPKRDAQKHNNNAPATPALKDVTTAGKN